MKKKQPNRKKGQSRAQHAGVKAKKHLGQHFLTSEETALKIAQTLEAANYDLVVEIGPGTGVLTKHLLARNLKVLALEIDRESIAYLEAGFGLNHPNLPLQNFSVSEQDFLKADLATLNQGKEMGITGNFPYNISTQIVFKVLEQRQFVPEFSGMFQKEVAQRICAKPGSKVYGILSVLTQVFYETQYLFTVPPGVFNPPPKVDSGVMHMSRKENQELPVSESLLFKVVKQAFQQRRKTLRNSLKNFQLSDTLREEAIFNKRPEQLHYTEFIELTQKIAIDAVSNQ